MVAVVEVGDGRGDAGVIYALAAGTAHDPGVEDNVGGDFPVLQGLGQVDAVIQAE